MPTLWTIREDPRREVDSSPSPSPQQQRDKQRRRKRLQVRDLNSAAADSPGAVARKVASSAKRQLRRRERPAAARSGSSPGSAQRPGQEQQTETHWKEQQQNTLLLWIRATIASAALPAPAPASTLLEACSDGVVLCDLVCALTGAASPAGMRRPPSTRVHSIENCNLGLAALAQAGVELGSNVCAEDFVDRAAAPVTGFIWLLFKRMVGGQAERVASLQQERAAAERRAAEAQAEIESLREQLRRAGAQASASASASSKQQRRQLEQQERAVQALKAELGAVCDECEALDAKLSAQQDVAEQLQAERQQGMQLRARATAAEDEAAALRQELQRCRQGCQVACGAYRAASLQSATEASEARDALAELERKVQALQATQRAPDNTPRAEPAAVASTDAWKAEAQAGAEHLAAAYGTGRADALLGVQRAGWILRKESSAESNNISAGSCASQSGLRWKRRWAVLSGGRLSFFRGQADAQPLDGLSLHGAKILSAAPPPKPPAAEQHGFISAEHLNGQKYDPNRHAFAFRLDLSEGCGARVSLRALDSGDWEGWLQALGRSATICNRVAEAEERSALMTEMASCAGWQQAAESLGGGLSARLIHAAYGGSGARDRMVLSGADCSGCETKLLLAACLNRSADLQVLELAGCGLGEHGALAVAGALPQLAALTSLDLSDNGLRPSGLLSLLTFSLQRNCAPSTPDIVALKLDGNDLGAALVGEAGEDGACKQGAVAKVLAQITGLESLSLSRCGLGKASAAGVQPEQYLPTAPSLRTLQLSENGFAPSDCGGKEDGAGEPTTTPKKKPLSSQCGQSPSRFQKPKPPPPPPAGRRRVAGPLVRSLLQLQGLHSLDLSGNPLGSDGARCIASCLLRRHESLSVLSLGRCSIEAAGVRALAAVLEEDGATNLQSLHLGGNPAQGALRGGVAADGAQAAFVLEQLSVQRASRVNEKN